MPGAGIPGAGMLPIPLTAMLPIGIAPALKASYSVEISVWCDFFDFCCKCWNEPLTMLRDDFLLCVMAAVDLEEMVGPPKPESLPLMTRLPDLLFFLFLLERPLLLALKSEFTS